MIRVKKYSNIIEISGHANYADYGKDIVCASVSSIITTTINYIMNIDPTSISYQDDGKIIKITKLNDNNIVKTILNIMIEIFKDLEKQYKENIKIESEAWKCYI